MSARIDKVVVPGVFSLDGQDFDVENNVWLVGDDDEAEDVLQEAYMRAFAAIEGFRGEASLSTWLTRITLNEARGRLRRRRPSVALDALEAAQEAGAALVVFPRSISGLSPEREAARSETRRLMEAAIDELPEPFRLVFILREIEECTVEETAGQLDILPETVKTRLFRHVEAVAPQGLVTKAVIREGPFALIKVADPDGNVLELYSITPPARP